MEVLPPFKTIDEFNPSKSSIIIKALDIKKNSPESSQRGLQRANWLVVHNGSRISISSLINAGMRADGCHSTLGDDGVVITYIHMTARCRQTSVSKFMDLQFGSSSVKSIKEVDDQSAEFQLLARHLQEKHVSFISDGIYFCILSKAVKSAVSTATSRNPVNSELENAKLRQRLFTMERERMEMENNLRAALEDCVRVKGEMGSLHQQLSRTRSERMECESELKRLRIENTEFRRLGATDKEVRRLNRELMTLKDDLDAKSHDCKALEIMLRIAGEDCAKLNRAAAMAPRPSNYMRE
jgi:hypothetical protein